MKIKRSITKPIREFIDMEHRWDGDDKGLIWCWESGRLMAQEKPDFGARAKNGELMVLTWKGGVQPKYKQKRKNGTLNYLAQWQGLSGQNLDIDTEEVVSLVCSATDVEVFFTKEIPTDEE